MKTRQTRMLSLGASALLVLAGLMGGGAASAAASSSPPVADATRVTAGASAPAAIKYLSPAPRPVITGAPFVRELLTANPGTWGPAPVTLTYAWYASGTLIEDETGPTLRPVVDYAFARITVVVTGSKPGYQTVSRTSNPTAAIQIGGDPFTSAPKPVISGTGLLGSRLTANTGAWAPGPVTFTYVWWRNDVRIPDATGRTYTVTVADAGARITVTATGSSPGIRTESKTSAAVRLPS